MNKDQARRTYSHWVFSSSFVCAKIHHLVLHTEENKTVREFLCYDAWTLSDIDVTDILIDT